MNTLKPLKLAGMVSVLAVLPVALALSWSRLSEQIIRFDKWNLCRG